MAPYRDMFVEYTDLQGHGLVVRLGDEEKMIPIVGRGTLCINILGHHVAYADALHVPDLSVILLPSRVHRRITPGCSFIADHTGCFSTYPTFVIEVDDTDDCTIPCARISGDAKFEFDSRVFLTNSSSPSDTR
jgi:hypothetical protein